MRKTCFIGIASLLLVIGLGLQTRTVFADTFELTDGQTLSGDVVSFDERGLVVRLPDDKYSDRVPWAKFSQSDLKRLAQNPKVAPLVEPFLEVPLVEKPKKPPVVVTPPPRLARPPAQSLLGAMASSSVGITVLLIVYAANLYAAFEVSIFRGQPRMLVCGLAAVPIVGILSPIVFLALPVKRHAADADLAAEPELPTATYAVPGQAAEPAADPAGAPGSLRLSQAQGGRSTGTLPVTQVFQRGAYTFNRRFFETKFPGFFGVIRRDAEKDMVLLVKSPKGQFTAHRISRIAANDIHLQIQKGATNEEVAIPFTEIQEVQLKHKDA